MTRISAFTYFLALNTVSEINLIETLESAARRWPEKPALIEEDTNISYSALVQQTHHFAKALNANGISRGLRVGLRFPNSIAYVALTYALWRIGAIVVPVPNECTEQEVADIAESMELAAILSHRPRPHSLEFHGGCHLTLLPRSGAPDNHGLNIAFIRFTSGTTNARKGVVLSHETVLQRIHAANDALGLTESDTVLWSLPMSHHFLITIVLYLNQGATIVLVRSVLAHSVLNQIAMHSATVLYATPFQFSMLAREKSKLGIPTVRRVISTTCPLSEDVAEDFLKRFDRPISQALGIMEIGLAAVNLADPVRRWNSVGRPLATHRVCILDPDEEGCGEIAIRGPGMFDAYAAPWMPREALSHDGWFTTGDIGRLDADGFLFLLSRKTAVINLAGRKVFPEEIEAVLNRHPAVRESRVYGRRHQQLGEVVEADVVLNDAVANLDSVRALCSQNLAPYKVPSRFHVVPALPRTATTGKIRREALAA